MSSLISKYRPATLAQIVGQSAAVAQLRSFAASPYSGAFLFHGPTGVGKTASARALAYDLGCPREHEAFGGLHEIPSGQQDGKAVEELKRLLWFRPMLGAGWKVAIINEADYMTPQAEAMWLDVLEDLPAKSVIIFTTNNIHKLSRRLIGRCESIAFDGESPAFRRGLTGLVRKIIKTETGNARPALPLNLGRYELASKCLSIRLALQQIAPYIRGAAELPAEVDVPFIRDEETIRAEVQSSAAKKAWTTRRRQFANARKESP